MTGMKKSDQHSQELSKTLAEVFRDANSLMVVSQIIKKHLTNKLDIRDIALNGLDLSKVRKIIDLGCGCGFFTHGLKGRVHKDAEITGIDRHPKCKQLYLKACDDVDIKGKFLGRGISVIEEIEDNSVDIIICSYALYFFPDYINHISRILKEDGFFVTITHSRPHMKEFTDYVKKILIKNSIDFHQRLPYEALIENFSNTNGKELLSSWFDEVKTTDYRGTLVFNQNEFDHFEKYFNFKHTFFIPGNDMEQEELTEIILEKVKMDLKKTGQLKITKDDTIFVCSGKKKNIH
ncbi:MAG: class I SAM-dependent methyltransferase [Bacteroidales bacterium]|nr:class I SAM-dependent methyltransferase [Bacteroidales bacterium]